MLLNISKSRLRRVSHYQMTYVEMLQVIPNLERAQFNSDFRTLLYEYIPVAHDKRILHELARKHCKLEKLIAKGR